MANEEIKKLMKDNKVRQWQIAEYIGVNESLLSRKMRHELDSNLKESVIKAINVLGGGRLAQTV